MMKSLFAFSIALVLLGGPIGSALAADPDFGPNVMVFDPSMTDIQPRIDAVFKKQEAAQFGDGRYAYLFKPGKYNLDVEVGFYMEVAGLGRSPDDVQITGDLRSPANWMSNHNATCNFWRGATNLAVTPTRDNNTAIWAVSQATELRRVHIVNGGLNLWDGGWSSGGFMADCKVDGIVNSGSQQQWLSRNDDWGTWKGGSWNMVFVGDKKPPGGQWPQQPYTVIDQTPVIREKPYLFVDAEGKYSVLVPRMSNMPTKGTTWASGPTAGQAISLDDFFIARSDRDTAETINAALAAGKNLLLTPGLYRLDAAIKVTRPDTVVLGLGYPTLTPQTGAPAMMVADVDGVKIGGLLLEAGPVNSPVLLQVGFGSQSPSQAVAHARDPIMLYDIFARAGGAIVGTTDCYVTINSSNVVGDNFWLWRADHGRGAAWNSNKTANGLIVNGADVTIYGLFVEHTQQYQTLWNGEGGRVYFYQSELPYDPPNQAAWQHDGENGYASYKVADNVKTHEAWGLGVYSVFHARDVLEQNAIEAPTGPGIQIHHLIVQRLNGGNGSGFSHIYNGQGDQAITKMTAKMD